MDHSFPTVLRNLSLAYFNKLGKKKEAVQLLEQAFQLDRTDARILMELDQLYKRMDYSPKERLLLLDSHKEIVVTRDDLYLEYATLLNLTGKYEQAMQLIDRRQFHPWEGGEGKVPAQYQYARMQLAKKSLKVKQQRPQKYATREYNRCKICGRPHAYIRKFGICRICFRELAYKGQIPGVKKSSW